MWENCFLWDCLFPVERLLLRRWLLRERNKLPEVSPIASSHLAHLQFRYDSKGFFFFSSRPPFVFHKPLSIKDLWNGKAWKTSCKTSRKTSHRPHQTPPVLPTWFTIDALSAYSFQVNHRIASSNFFCEFPQAPTGGLRWGLWEVLHEVLK